MYKRFFLILFLITNIFSFSAKAENHASDLIVDQLLQDFFDYKHFIDSINSYQNYENTFIDVPAGDIYMNIWTSERVNPYRMPIDSLSYPIHIDVSEFVLPVPGRVTSRFGVRRSRFHYGTDLSLRIGEPVRVAFSGKVRIINFNRHGYGHYVVVRHHNGLETLYAHLSRVLVEHDQIVNAGDTIALGGNTGRSTGPHLHFEIRYIGNAINPEHVVDFTTGTLRNDHYLITRNQTFAHQADIIALQAAQYVTVRSGDSLSRIAQRNGTTVNRLCQLNGITTRTILRPGQRLRIR